MPILEGDSIAFPEKFSIKIYNEDYTELLKKINSQEFKQVAIAKYMSSTKNFLTAQSYKLVIDSTLLGLDKLKRDSIR